MSATNPLQTKHVPKDAQVIMSILKDMGVVDFEPQTIVQLLEFTYRYVTSALEDARVYANHANKKVIDVEDVQLAVHMQLDKNFTTPPPRDMLLEVARNKNSIPLPQIRPHCGIRLPPDRYCMTACNYELKSINKKGFAYSNGLLIMVNKCGQAMRFRYLITSETTWQVLTCFQSVPTDKRQFIFLWVNATAKSSGGVFNSSQSSIFKPQIKPAIKRSIQTVARTQAVTIPKPVIKFTSSGTIQTGEASAAQQAQQQTANPQGLQSQLQQSQQTQSQQQQHWKTGQQPVVQTVLEVDEPPASLIKRRISDEEK